MVTGIVLGQAQSCVEVHRLLIGSCLRVAVMLARLVFGRHACPDASIGCTCITWLIHLLQTDMQLHAGVGELGEDVPWLHAWVCSMHNQTHSCSETDMACSVGWFACARLTVVGCLACLPGVPVVVDSACFLDQTVCLSSIHCMPCFHVCRGWSLWPCMQTALSKTADVPGSATTCSEFRSLCRTLVLCPVALHSGSAVVEQYRICSGHCLHSAGRGGVQSVCCWCTRVADAASLCWTGTVVLCGVGCLCW